MTKKVDRRVTAYIKLQESASSPTMPNKYFKRVVFKTSKYDVDFRRVACLIASNKIKTGDARVTINTEHRKVNGTCTLIVEMRRKRDLGLFELYALPLIKEVLPKVEEEPVRLIEYNPFYKLLECSTLKND